LGFWWDCIESVDWFWSYGHFNNINSSNPFHQLLLPLSLVLCNFHCGVLSPPWLVLFLGIFWGYCEWNCYPDFFLSEVIVDRKATHFQTLIFVSWQFVKFAHNLWGFW
jgi:hypothetical protein